MPLDLADEVQVEVDEANQAAPRLELDPPRPHVPSGAENLALRAATAFCRAAGLDCAVRVVLRKEIPAAAGLGGGSSDAGAVLRALAERFPAALTPAALAKLALELGADVPFFLAPRAARVSGVGEIRAALGGALPALDLLLANPGQPLETAAVFRAYVEEPGPAAGPLDPDLAAVLARPQAAELQALARNDLVAAAQRLCPALPALRAALDAAGALATGLSGSGATLYGVFQGREAAELARERLIEQCPPTTWLRVARTGESR